MNDWLPRVAKLVYIMFDYWKDLAPVRPSPSIGRAAILFHCIHALMSYQIQGLLKRSLQHLYNTIEVYKVHSFPTKFSEVKRNLIYHQILSPKKRVHKKKKIIHKKINVYR